MADIGIARGGGPAPAASSTGDDKSDYETGVSTDGVRHRGHLDIIRAAKQAEGETFASGGETRYYEPIDTYEGKHRWDPNAEWTEQEERRLVRKLDWKI